MSWAIRTLLVSISLFVITPALRAADASPTTRPDETTLKPAGTGWISLFDGKSLNGWMLQDPYWKVQDGVLYGHTPGEKEHHYAYTEKSYDDFELHVDLKLVGNNTGVSIRVTPVNFDNVPGYQVDAGDNYWGCLWDEKGRGYVVKYPKAEAGKILHKDDWNHYYVRAEGHHIQMWLNGVKTVDLVDEKGALSGKIGFQLCHGEGKVTDAWFKNILLRPLSAAATK